MYASLTHKLFLLVFCLILSLPKYILNKSLDCSVCISLSVYLFLPVRPLPDLPPTHPLVHPSTHPSI